MTNKLEQLHFIHQFTTMVNQINEQLQPSGYKIILIRDEEKEAA